MEKDNGIDDDENDKIKDPLLLDDDEMFQLWAANSNLYFLAIALTIQIINSDSCCYSYLV
jgi:hypothetical protein